MSDSVKNVDSQLVNEAPETPKDEQYYYQSIPSPALSEISEDDETTNRIDNDFGDLEAELALSDISDDEDDSAHQNQMKPQEDVLQTDCIIGLLIKSHS